MYHITEAPIVFDEQFASYMKETQPQMGQYYLDTGRLNVTTNGLDDGTAKMFHWKLWVKQAYVTGFPMMEREHPRDPYEYAYDEDTQEVVVMYVTPEGALLTVTRISVPVAEDESIQIMPSNYDGNTGEVYIIIHKQGTVSPYREITNTDLNPNNALFCGRSLQTYSALRRGNPICGRPANHFGECVGFDAGFTAIGNESSLRTFPHRMIGHVLRCAECDIPYLKSNTPGVTYDGCDTCKYWVNQKLEPGSLIFKGVHYRWGPSHGYGGRKFTVSMLDENGNRKDTVSRQGIWFQGRIPEHFRDRFPDNVIIEGL